MKINVFGLGYVGLTLALTLADIGYKVTGIDKDPDKISKLNSGIPTMYEPQLAHMLTSTISCNKISFSCDPIKNDEETIHIIAVGTPVNPDTHEPITENIASVAKEIGKILNKNDTVILRSTVPVSTTRNLLKPIIETESNLKTPGDFYLASAPERTLQGLALKELRELPQIVGGIDEPSVEKASTLFNNITKTVVRVSSLEAAELVKLIDNTYRDITISIANMYGKICQKLNLDAKEVISAANYGYARNKILFPGPGVGGGCLVKDPYLLLASLKNDPDLNLIKFSRNINDSMTDEMCSLIEQCYSQKNKSLTNSKMLVLGFAFKGYPPTDDIRFSPTLDVVKFLKEKNVQLYGYDPVVPRNQIDDLGVSSLEDLYSEIDFDSILIMNNNPHFRDIDFKKFQTVDNLLVIDGWYLYDKASLNNLGINYFALGSKR